MLQARSTPISTMLSDEEIRSRYGPDAIVSLKGAFVLVHLDRPSPDEVLQRTKEFDPENYFERGCPLCALQRASGVYVFDDYPEEDEEILLE